MTDYNRLARKALRLGIAGDYDYTILDVANVSLSPEEQAVRATLERTKGAVVWASELDAAQRRAIEPGVRGAWQSMAKGLQSSVDSGVPLISEVEERVFNNSPLNALDIAIRDAILRQESRNRIAANLIIAVVCVTLGLGFLASLHHSVGYGDPDRLPCTMC